MLSEMRWWTSDRSVQHSEKSKGRGQCINCGRDALPSFIGTASITAIYRSMHGCQHTFTRLAFVVSWLRKRYSDAGSRTVLIQLMLLVLLMLLMLVGLLLIATVAL